MPWPKLLVLVRHAESEGNVRTVDERTEYEISTHAYDLTARGREQARLTGEYLRRTYGDFDVYYSSYYKRAKETLRIIAPPGAKLYEDARLAEGQRGIWHVMTHAEVLKAFPKEVERKRREGLYHYRPFGGENWADIELRIHSFLGTLNRDCPADRVEIVVHGHWLVLFQRLIERFSIERAERLYKGHVVENASVHVYGNKKILGKNRLVALEQNVVPWKGKV